MKINTGHIDKYARYYPEKLFYFLFVIFISANGLIISVGRAWTVPQLLAMAMLFFVGLKLITCSNDRKFNVLPFPFALLTIWLILLAASIYTAPPQPYFPFPGEILQSYKIVGVMFYFWIVLDVIIMWVVYNFVKSPDIFIKTIKLLIYSSLFFSVYGIYQYFMADLFGSASDPVVYALNYHYLYYDYIVRLLSLSREPLYFVNYITPVIIIISTLIITKGYEIIGLSKRLLFIILGINLIAFFLSKSTGGFIGALGSMSVVLLIYYKNNLKNISVKNIATATILLVVVTLSFYCLYGSGIERRISRLLNPTSGYGRIVSVLEALESFWVYPFLGFGLGHSQFFISITQIHNAYLNILAETGVFSLLCFITFLSYLSVRLYTAYQNAGIYKGLVLGISGAFIYILIQWLSFFAYIVLFAWFLFGIILALPETIRLLRQKNGFIRVKE